MGFAAAAEETSSIEFSITDPKGHTIFEKADEPEGLFHFVAKHSGLYTFILSNHKWMQERMVTFSLGKGNETHLQAEHLETVEDHVKAIDKTLVDIQTESTYLWIDSRARHVGFHLWHSMTHAYAHMRMGTDADR